MMAMTRHLMQAHRQKLNVTKMQVPVTLQEDCLLLLLLLLLWLLSQKKW